MAFRKKAEFILKYKPDILVIPECEHPDKLLFTRGTPKPKDVLWFGKNRNKGLGIFSYSKFRFKVLDRHNQDLQLIVPISITGGSVDFNLFAVWANNPFDKDGQYVEQVWKAIHHYADEMVLSKTVIAGDFNSNKIWDKKNRESNHSNVVEHLEKIGIRSSYHVHHKQNQGSEAHPTLYMYRHKDKPYHIDYCFVSDNMIAGLKSVEIGEFDYWSKYSDHVPVIVSFKIPRL
jgi:exodeoxyribonuclease-3